MPLEAQGPTALRSGTLSDWDIQSEKPGEEDISLKEAGFAVNGAAAYRA